jgi:hypothetical protein
VGAFEEGRAGGAGPAWQWDDVAVKGAGRAAREAGAGGGSCGPACGGTGRGRWDTWLDGVRGSGVCCAVVCGRGTGGGEGGLGGRAVNPGGDGKWDGR